MSFEKYKVLYMCNIQWKGNFALNLHLDRKLCFLKVDKADQAQEPIPALCTSVRDLSQHLSLGRKGPGGASSIIPKEIRSFQGCQGDLCVCVCVSVCMYMWVCACACMCACVYIRVSVYMHVCVYVCACVCCECVCVCVYFWLNTCALTIFTLWKCKSEFSTSSVSTLISE